MAEQHGGDKPARKRRQATETSRFGSPGRASHDASVFYSSRMYEDRRPEVTARFVEAELPAELVNTILLKSSRDMRDLPDGCIHLMVTSPPYNVQKEYDQNLTLEEYRTLLRDVFA
jgi:hypothetical protein